MVNLENSGSALPKLPQLQTESVNADHRKHGLTVLTTTVFAVGGMAGSGVLALPSALKGTGVYTGVMLNVMCALVSAYTGMLLGRCWLMVVHRYDEYKQPTRYPYPAMGYVTFGRPGRLLVSLAINATLFGVGVVFLLLSAQNVESLVSRLGWNWSFCYWQIIVAGLLLPVSWLGTPKDFWPIAVGAVAATSVACVVVVTNVGLDSVELLPAFHPNLDFKSFFMAFGTICFAFGGHPAFPTFQADMRNPEKFGLAIFISYIIVLLMYLPVAISGYLVYGVNAQDNILLSVSDGPMLDIVEILITLHLFCGFIIVLNPVCQDIEEILRVPRHFGPLRVLNRTVIMAIILFVAESVPHFGAILSLVGGSTTTLLAYILPPIFYLKLCSMEGDWKKVTAPLHEKVACAEIMIIGAIAGVASTYSAVSDLISSSFSTPCYLNIDRAA